MAILYKTRVVDGKEVADAGDAGEAEAKVLRYLKTYAVFNAEQLMDCPEAYLNAPKVDPAIRAAACHAVLDAVPAKIESAATAAATSARETSSVCRRRRRSRPSTTTSRLSPTSRSMMPSA